MKIKKEHLDKLTRGKRSGVSIGSRNVGHRLTKLERAAFERAKKHLYLNIKKHQRSNLCNVWQKYCLIAQITELTLISENSEAAVVMCGDVEIFQGPLKEAKNFIIKQVK